MHKWIRASIFTIIGDLGVTDGLALPATGVQQASAPGQIYTTATQRTVVSQKTLSTTYTNKSERIARCTIATKGGTCTIAKGKSATRSIQVSTGFTRAGVASGLGISAGSTVTTTVSCTSPKLNAGQSRNAWPQGSRYSYQLQTKVVRYNMYGATTVLSTSKTGTLYAFNPKASYITCGI